MDDKVKSFFQRFKLLMIDNEHDDDYKTFFIFKRRFAGVAGDDVFVAKQFAEFILYSDDFSDEIDTYVTVDEGGHKHIVETPSSGQIDSAVEYHTRVKGVQVGLWEKDAVTFKLKYL